MNEINISNQEQSQGISVLNSSLGEIEGVTQVNNSSSKKISEYSFEVENQVSEVQNIIDQITVIILGENNDTKDKDIKEI